MKIALLVIFKDLTKKDKLIRFSHPTQDLTKVCTYVEIFYDGDVIEDKAFFLEKQDIRNNKFDVAILKNKQSIRIKTQKVDEKYTLELLHVEII